MSDQEILKRANEFPHLWGKYSPEIIAMLDKYSEDKTIKATSKAFVCSGNNSILEYLKRYIQDNYEILITNKIITA